MQVFDNVIYMDVQKTGSTAITRFLRLNLSYENWVSDKHARLRRDPAIDEVFLISRRDVVDLWVSLYNYGCDGRGALHKHLTEAGLADGFYSGRSEDFDAWVRFCLNPKNAAFLLEDYPQYVHLGLGFQSFRFLVMALPRPIRVLSSLRSETDVIPTFHNRTMIRHIIRTSDLEADLLRLAHGPLASHLSPGALGESTGEAPVRRNPSTPHVRNAQVAPETASFIRDREWFLEHVAATWVDRPHTS